MTLPMVASSMIRWHHAAMGEIVNLKQHRKRLARAEAAEEAAAQRARHGRTRAERDAEAKRHAAARRVLDGAKLDTDGT